jgi:hypothetical protein
VEIITQTGTLVRIDIVLPICWNSGRAYLKFKNIESRASTWTLLALYLYRQY